MSSENNENNHEDNMRSISHDLNSVEASLDEQNSSATLGGRVVFDSITSFLGSIRSRLEGDERLAGSGHNEQGSSERASLWQRLSNAERAHQTRMPLRSFRQELQRRSIVNSSQRSSSSATTPSAPGPDPTAAPPSSSLGNADDDEISLSNDSLRLSARRSHGVHNHRTPSPPPLPPLRQSFVDQRRVFSDSTSSPIRRPSILASRRKMEQQEHDAYQADLRSSHHGSKDQSEIDDTERDVIMHDGDEADASMKHVTATSTPQTDLETPLLLTSSSHSKLDDACRSVLFSQQAASPLVSSETMIPKSRTLVYSWGSMDTIAAALHDDNDAAISTTPPLHRSMEQFKVLPTSKLGRTEILSASMGSYHAAVSSVSGQVYATGRNVHGQVDPDNAKVVNVLRLTHVEALGPARILQISCGLDHTAAVSSQGTVLSWGSNADGQLGHVHSAMTAGPHRPAMLRLGPQRRAQSVHCGDGYTIVLTSRMTVLACGVQEVAGYHHRRDDERQTTSPPLPAPIPALEDLPIVHVAAGRRHAVVVTAHGTALCWGDNEFGCCGRDYPAILSVPTPMRMPASALAPPPGPYLAEPLTNWAYWDGTDRSVSIAGDLCVTHAACGDHHTVLVTKSGRLLVCGNNAHGQLGLSHNQAAVSSLQAVAHKNAQRRFEKAAAGAHHSLVLDDMGDVWQLGGSDGESNDANTVLRGKRIQWITAGGEQSLAVTTIPGQLPLRRDFSARSMDDCDGSLVDSVEDLIRSLKQTNSYSSGDTTDAATSELTTRTEELLRIPSVLNSLFMDPTELDELYSKLLAVETPGFRQSIATAMERGIQRGLETINVDDARLIYPEQVRFLLLYLQCPLFVDWEKHDCDDKQPITFDRRGDVILCLCDTILGLSYEGYKALMGWVMSIYPRNRFRQFLLEPLLAQLSKSMSKSAGAETRPKRAIVAILRWLHGAAERSQGALALPEDFYCAAMGKLQAEELLSDLVRWKRANAMSGQQQPAPPAAVRDFYYCDHPFLMSPSIKRNLLRIENEMNMFQTAASDGNNVRINHAEGFIEFNPFYVLEISREHLLADTLKKVALAEPKDLRKKLRIVFAHEEGVDAGGVTREFFQLLCAQLFAVGTGMWSAQYGDNVTWFNTDCSWNDEGYFLCGVLVGLAVYNGVLLDVHFPQAVYRKLLGLSLGLEDMVDEAIKDGLQQLLDYDGDDVEDVFCLTFDVAWRDYLDSGGDSRGNPNDSRQQRRELKPGGLDLPVTAANKEEYVMLYVKWLLVDSVYPQFDAFERGFLRVMENTSLDLLRAEELELLVVGTPELDFTALEHNTEYEGGYDGSSPVVRNFWKFVQGASLDTQLLLLKFATGSTKAPIGGLGQLAFKIQRAGPDSMSLPTSHTCFNTLLLPDYGNDYDKLTNRMSRAILECEGFGLQ